MKLTPTAIDAVWRVDLAPFDDARGRFVRTFDADVFRAHGLGATFIQSSISQNRARATLRGVHYQLPPYEETKLVRCSRGRVFDVAVDLRPASKTYCRWVGLELDALTAVWLGPGIAHGFVTLEDDSELSYQISAPYAPDAARGVRWDDPLFAISWPIAPLVMSERDRAWPDYVPRPTR